MATPRFFELGKIQHPLSGRYEYIAENPLYNVEYDWRKDFHCLQEVFKRDHIIDRYFFFDIVKSMPNPGPVFSKTVKKRTRLYYTPKSENSGELRIVGDKTYSRRSEGKSRIYPVEHVKNRVVWFLTNSPFVETFKLNTHSNKFVFTIEIKFASSYSDSALEEIRDCQRRTDIRNLEYKAEAIKTKIQNFVSKESLQSQYDAVMLEIEKLTK